MADEIKIEEAEFNSLRHPLQEQVEMDVIFAYKNLLALEDHLREFQPENDEEETWRDHMLKSIERMRSSIFTLLEEKDKRYHCMAKHASAALMGLEEVSKLYHQQPGWPQSEDFDIYADNMRNIHINILEKLWGHEIENCKRCK